MLRFAMVVLPALLFVPRVAAAQDEPLPETSRSSPASSARAEPEPVSPPVPVAPLVHRGHFGADKVVFLSAYSSLGIASTTYSDDSKSNQLDVGFSPGFDVFLAKGISVGLELTLAYSHSKSVSVTQGVDTNVTSVGGGLRFGIAIPLAERIFLHPRGVVGYDTSTVSEDVSNPFTPATGASSSGSKTARGAYAALFVPVVFELAPNLYAGFGPRVERAFGDSAGSGRAAHTTISGTALLGVTLGGEGEAAPSSEVEAPAERFGDRHQLVVTGALGADVAARFEQRSNRQNVFLSPAIDFFVLRSLSIGLAPQFVYEHLDQRTRTSYALDARVGWGFALGRFTLWPRLGVGVVRSFDESVSIQTNHIDFTAVRLDGDLALLFHFVPHAFVGGAPRIAHELTRTYDSGADSLRQTQLALEFLAGGWF